MRVDVDKIKLESKGRWLDIFLKLGIDVGSGKHQPCPACGGTDRFRYDNKHDMGDYYCSQCGSGDGFSLLQKILGIDFIKSAALVGDMLNISAETSKDPMPPKTKADPKVMLKRVWDSSLDLLADDPVSTYLRLRGIILTPEHVRFCPKCYESDSKKEFPAMIARVSNREGRPISIHRTYLDFAEKGWDKAPLEEPKKVMPPTEELKGSAIRLFSNKNNMFDPDILGIAEGIETAMSAAQIFGVATWAVMTTALMEAFEPPEGYRRFVIFADNDPNFSGQKAAYSLANKLYRKDFLVDVCLPNGNTKDWNDQLVGWQATKREEAQGEKKE